MFSKIIVPLDGSILAEEALPYATRLTKQLNATLVLVRVQVGRPLVVEFSHSPQIDAGNLIHAGNIQPNRPGLAGTEAVSAYSTDQYQVFTSYSGEQDDEDYLQKIKGKLVGLEADTRLKAEQIQTRVVCGRSPKELAAIVKEEHADLVVMTTHGRSGLSLMLTGSIAAKLIQHTSLPVIVIKPDETTDQTQEQSEKPAVDFSLDPILVTLDGSPVSETILETATNLALGLGVKIHLFEEVSNVIPGGDGGVGGVGGFYYLPEYDLDKEITILNNQSSQYLKEIQARLSEKGVECVTEVQTGEPRITLDYNNGEPVARIIAYASQIKAQLVAMTTHGRGKLGQLVLGSVAEEVVRQSHLPVLLMKKAVHSRHIVEN